MWTSPVQGSDPAEVVQASDPQVETQGLKWDSAAHGPTGAGIPLDQSDVHCELPACEFLL